MEMWSMPTTLETVRGMGSSWESCGHNGPDVGLFPVIGEDLMSKALAILALVSGVLFAGAAQAGTIEQIRESGTLRIGYDPDAPPFSYIVPGSPANAEPLGYSVELCRAVVKKLQEQLKIAT